MSTRGERAAIWVIWGLVAVLAGLEVAFWVQGGIPLRPLHLLLIGTAWVVMVLLALLATRTLMRLRGALVETEAAHRATQHEVVQLQLHNEMLEILARSVDVPLAFQALARRIPRLVPCDRVGLALLTGAGEFQTYTARVHEVERRRRPRPEVVFKAEGTAIGHAVRSREPLIVDDTGRAGGDFLDMNVLHSAGFASALLLPLVTQGESVGTLNVVSRKAGTFTRAHVDALLPVSEIFAVAYVAQRLQAAAARDRATAALTELTLGIAAEINGALQTIVGHCDLLARGYPDPNLQRDLATLVSQAQRIAALLERMRAAAREQGTEHVGWDGQSGAAAGDALSG